MDQLFSALKDVKVDVDQMSFDIQREEDALAVLDIALRGQELKKKELLKKLAKYEVDHKLAEGEYNVGLMKKEKLIIEFKSMKYQLDEVQRQMAEKEAEIQELANILALKENELLQLENSNHAAYMEFPPFREYFNAAETCAALGESLEEAGNELKALQQTIETLNGPNPETDHQQDNLSQKALSQKNEQKQTGDEVNQYTPPTSQITPEMKGIQEILAKFVELAEENRILKNRLERLELANKVSFPDETFVEPAPVELMSLKKTKASVASAEKRPGTRFTVQPRTSSPITSLPVPCQTVIQVDGQESFDFDFDTTQNSYGGSGTGGSFF